MAAPVGYLGEAAPLWWRERPNARTLRRDGRLWTAWTAAVATPFFAAGGFLLWLEPLTLPVAAGSFAHGWVIPELYARRGARSVVPIWSAESASHRREASAPAEQKALGLLGDLVGHGERELLRETGLALERGRLGVWLVGEQGAMMVRPGGRRTDCWCVRISEPGSLPAGDRVAHLLLALREDEEGFATVANLAFSGATWRVRRRMPKRSRPALDAARAHAAGLSSGS
ncbi:MAG: hypothetical protein ACRDMA_09925 [Solirubrobacterales bacterium]